MGFLRGLFAIFFIIAIIALILGLPVMWLWDAIMPDIFGLPVITFWQALGMNLLSGFLFRTGFKNS